MLLIIGVAPQLAAGATAVDGALPNPPPPKLLGAAVAASAAWHAQDWRYNARIAQMQQAHALSLQRAEASARQVERNMQAQVERIADEADKTQTKLVVRAAAAERSARGLRDEIARLNARPAPTDPEASSYAGEASAARELLGACSDRYTAVAKEADRIRDQVIGLQDYVKSVCHQSVSP